MAFEIPDHFHRTFTTNVELLLQQKTSRFDRAVAHGGYSGEAAQVIKQFGEVEFTERTSRHDDTNFSDIQHKQRWVFPSDFDLALPVDREDEIRMLDSPVSPYASAMRAGWNRKKDAVVSAAFFASAKTGKNGATSTAFDTSNQVVAVGAGAAAATGLNLEKLILAKEIFEGNEYEDDDDDELFMGIGKKQLSNLLRSFEVGSADHNDVKALVAGEVDQFMGITFIKYQSLPVDSNSYRRCPIWTKTGMHLGAWNNLFTRIGERPDKKYLTQVFMQGTIAATRTQEKRVVEIKCSEA